MNTNKTSSLFSAIRPMCQVLLLLILAGITVCGCHYSLKYPLTDLTIMQSQIQRPLNVAVQVLEDTRDDVERERSVRKKSGDPDAGDYTYDKDFGNRVASDISKMMVKHLEYSHAFDEVTLMGEGISTLDEQSLDSLASENTDAVLTGKIRHFYGYYDQKVGKQVLIAGGLALAIGIPVAIMTTTTEKKAFGFEEVKTNPLAISLATSSGFMLGSWLESTGKRKIEWHTQLEMQLISTTTGEMMWQGSADISEDTMRAMPGLKTATRKQEVAVNSLRLAVNDLVVSLSKAQIAIQ